MDKSLTVIIYRDRRVGCKACVELCPAGMLYLDDEGKCSATDDSKCDMLRGCERVCPTGAIRISG